MDLALLLKDTLVHSLLHMLGKRQPYLKVVSFKVMGSDRGGKKGRLGTVELDVAAPAVEKSRLVILAGGVLVINFDNVHCPAHLLKISLDMGRRCQVG